MATWDTQIDVANLPARRLNVTAIRRDDVGAETWRRTVTVAVGTGPTALETAKTQAVTALKQLWATDKEESDAKTALIGNLPSLVAADLNAGE